MEKIDIGVSKGNVGNLHADVTNDGFANTMGTTSVFFFQAEDGIRDSSVTGVQTCALPISVAMRLRNRVIADLLDSEAAMTRFLNLIATEPEIARIPIMVDSSKWTVLEAGGLEERRVGEEGRSRWSPDH